MARPFQQAFKFRIFTIIFVSQGCLRETRKKIQMQRKQQSEVWPQGRTGREGSVAWKELKKWTWKLRAQELPFGAQDIVLVLVNEQTHMGETHMVCTQNASLLHLKGMLGSGALSGLIAWAWNGTAAVWEAVSIYYKRVCSPGCTSTGSTGRIRPFREGMSCCSAGQPMSLPPLLVIQGKLRLLFQWFFLQAACATSCHYFKWKMCMVEWASNLHCPVSNWYHVIAC